MIKTLLVAATGAAGDDASLAAALAVARAFTAHLDVLHVRLDPAAVAVAMMADGGGMVTAGLVEQLERDASEREATAHNNFARFCAAAGLAEADSPAPGAAARPTASWHVERGEEGAWMVRYGVAADLIVAPRASGEAAPGSATPAAVLLETGRPLLIPAAAPVPDKFDRIAIAWKPTAQAARAAAAALPFLVKAREVVVFTVAEAAAPDHAAVRLARSLAWHGVAATAKVLDPGPDGSPATLLSAAGANADLLVMGGYGHSRLREWVFGGFTQLALEGAPLPVLMAH